MKSFAPNHFYGIKEFGTGRTLLLYFKSREGNEVVFQTHDKRQFKGKVLTSAQTGEEVCFVVIDGIKHTIEAREGYSKGRRISEESLNTQVDLEWDEKEQRFVKTKDCGMLLKDFLAKKAQLAKGEKK